VLGLPLAIIHKQRRPSGDVVVHHVLGDVRGCSIVIVDDLISTGGTIEAAVSALRAAGCEDDISVLATHALLVGKAIERLAACRIRQLVRTDSVPSPQELPFPVRVVPLAPLLASTLRNM
jgi:ribose-phosphate pyrophosphokinase